MNSRNIVSLILAVIYLCLTSASGADQILVPSVEAPEKTVKESNLEVTVGQTVVIIPFSDTKCAYAAAKKLGNGDIIVSLPWPRTGEPIKSMRSKDGGHTWQESVSKVSYDDGKTWKFVPTPIYENFAILDNNTIIGFDFPDNPDLLWCFNADGTEGKAFAVDVSKMKRPEVFKYQRPLVQLKNGTILSINQVGEDNVDDITYRTVVICASADSGKSWDNYSTVAFDLFTSYRQEGFTEPRLQLLTNGDLLCFMRTGNPDTAARRGFPVPNLVVSKSVDEGKSWCAPMPVAEKGVYPDSCAMKNGVIALAYGRPGNNVVFSTDGGNTWICRFNVSGDTLRAPDCGHYNSIIEINDNTLMLVYGSNEEINKPRTEVLGTFLHINLKPVE